MQMCLMWRLFVFAFCFVVFFRTVVLWFCVLLSFHVVFLFFLLLFLSFLGSLDAIIIEVLLLLPARLSLFPFLVYSYCFSSFFFLLICRCLLPPSSAFCLHTVNCIVLYYRRLRFRFLLLSVLLSWKLELGGHGLGIGWTRRVLQRTSIVYTCDFARLIVWHALLGMIGWWERVDTRRRWSWMLNVEKEREEDVDTMVVNWKMEWLGGYRILNLMVIDELDHGRPGVMVIQLSTCRWWRWWRCGSGRTGWVTFLSSEGEWGGWWCQEPKKPWTRG